jgi:hypothetical protein
VVAGDAAEDRDIPRQSDIVEDVEPATRDIALDVLERTDTQRALRVISSLAPDQAEAVMLRIVVGLDAGQTAAVLGKRPGAVRIATMRGLRRLEAHPEVADRRRTTRPPVAASAATTEAPDPVWTPMILQVLTRHHAQATFLQLGAKANKYPQISKMVVDSGSEVGVHGFTHTDLSAAAAWRRSMELTLAGNAIAAASGRQPVGWGRSAVCAAYPEGYRFRR